MSNNPANDDEDDELTLRITNFLKHFKFTLLKGDSNSPSTSWQSSMEAVGKERKEVRNRMENQARKQREHERQGTKINEIKGDESPSKCFIENKIVYPTVGTSVVMTR